MRRLPRVDLSGSGRDNFIGIRAFGFLNYFESFSKSSGYRKSILLKLGNFYSRMLKNSFFVVEGIRHHHDENEAELEEVKLMKRLLRHLTIFYYDLSFGFN